MKKVYLLLVLTGLFSCFKGQGQLFTVLTDEQFLGRTEVCFGGGWIDYDQDDNLDLYLTHTQVNPYLYRNNGGELTEIISSGSMIPSGTYWSGISWGDFDNVRCIYER